MKNFDRVASIYDATRELPSDVPGRVADRVVAATKATTTTRFLELGVGTGRIALPFLERGYQYTGVDISEGMMNRLREKVAEFEVKLTLIQSDISQLPFENAHFNVVLGVHILHLVPDWHRALHEARRVLAPGGSLLLGYEHAPADDPGNEIRLQWSTFVGEMGVTLPTRGGHWHEVEAELAEAGAYTSVYRVAHWVEALRPGTLLDDQRHRVFSQSWDVPEDVLEAVYGRMVEWTTEKYGSLEAPLRSEQEFLLSVNRFPLEN